MKVSKTSIAAATVTTKQGIAPTPIQGGLQEKDIICGRGGASNVRWANGVYRDLLQILLPQYRQAKTHNEKAAITNKALAMLHDMDFRIVKLYKGNYYEVTRDKAYRKTAQFLRDGRLCNNQKTHNRQGKATAAALQPNNKATKTLLLPRTVVSFDGDVATTALTLSSNDNHGKATLTPNSNNKRFNHNVSDDELASFFLQAEPTTGRQDHHENISDESCTKFHSICDEFFRNGGDLLGFDNCNNMHPVIISTTTMDGLKRCSSPLAPKHPHGCTMMDIGTADFLLSPVVNRFANKTNDKDEGTHQRTKSGDGGGLANECDGQAMDLLRSLNEAEIFPQAYWENY